MSKKICKNFLFLILPFIFSSCVFAILADQNLGIDKAEYEDKNHFLLYFSGVNSEWGYPDKESLIVAQNSSDARNGIESHKIVKIEQNWWNILMGGYLYRCEVSPEFQTGETVYVMVRNGSIHDEIGGSGEFVVP